jgi:hypothetical protein
MDPIGTEDPREIWFGQDSHEYLIRALGLPLFAARMSYGRVEYDVPWIDDIDLSLFIMTQ